MKEQWSKIKEWWSNLALREKQAVAVCASLLVIFILYQLIWSPLLNQADVMRKRIIAQQKMLVWMQSADKQIQKIESHSQNKNKSLSPVALLSFVQKQINQVGLTQYLTQLKQATNESIEMHFQKVEFDKLIGLLTTISKEQNVTISQMSVVAESTPGIVSADIVLKLM